MYEDIPFFTKPEDEEQKIWRYMDITKYISMIEKKALYFSRADLLGDPFEGSIPEAIGQKNFNEIFKTQFEEMTKTRTDKVKFPSTFHDFIRKSCYACCFHMSSDESAALWSIYSKSNQGIAIQSTFKKLCDCFKDYSKPTVGIGTINYIDYSQNTIPVEKSTVSPLLYKRKSFECEKEIRALILDDSEIIGTNSDTGNSTIEIHIDLKPGIIVPINLDTLIDQVIIAPDSPEWIKDLLESIMEKYGIQKKVVLSSLDKSPII